MKQVLLIIFCNDTATTEIYTLSLHDALPIYGDDRDDVGEVQREVEVELPVAARDERRVLDQVGGADQDGERPRRSEEHTSELQSRQYIECRLLLVKIASNLL